MKAVTKIVFIDENGEKFFGEGPYRLLCLVEETGSLHSASNTMGMAYTKALKLLSNAEKALGFKLTIRSVGGKQGGGSTLTPECKEWLKKYEDYRNACKKENDKLYSEYFGK
ncbi:MAG: LysR family transcriptional regulator [Saccharofermentans sp.]|nr:LysR family transcriptional regulator [Saccharofermentans sp.]